MERYYELTSVLRKRLVDAGEDDAAEELLHAERGASTSGEAISNIGVVLRRLKQSGVLSRASVGGQADELEEVGRHAWDATHGR